MEDTIKHAPSEEQQKVDENIVDLIARNGRPLILILAPIISATAALSMGFDLMQIVAVVAFVISVLGAFLYWRYKLIIAFASITILLMLGVMDVHTLVESAEFDIILFLIAMTLVITPLKRAGFFRWLTILLLKWSNFSITKLLTYFMLTSMILAALMGSVTSIVLSATMIMEFCSYFELNPLVLLIAIILSTNIGSSATALGNPVGLILALGAGLSFEEFLRWATPPAFISLFTLILFFKWKYSKELEEMQFKIQKIVKEKEVILDVWATVEDIMRFSISVFIFSATVITIAFHKTIESFLHLKGMTMLVGIAFLGAAAALYLFRDESKEIIEKEVDWWSILFIAFLFSQTGALKYTGVTEKLAELIVNFVGGNEYLLLGIVAISAFGLSAFLDNVPTVAAFIPIVLSLARRGVEVYLIWWMLLIAGCYAGNLTPLASAANIIALGILEKKKVKITLKDWLRMCLGPAIMTFIIALAITLAQFYLIT